jgi:hypothetical protein
VLVIKSEVTDMAGQNNLDLDLDLDSDDELNHLKTSKRSLSHEEFLRNREIMTNFPNRYYPTQEGKVLSNVVVTGVWS